MKGLIIKDVRMLWGQKITLLLTVALPFFLADIGLEYALSFFVLFASMMGYSVIAYDSNDNSMAYLMTWPGGRSMYALEKYVLVLLPGAVATILVVGVRFAAAFIQKQPADATGVVIGFLCIFMFGTVLVALLIPVDLKFGPEKSKIVVAVIISVAVTGFVVLMGKVESVQEIYQMVLDGISGLGQIALFVCAAGIWAALLAVSVLCSVKIMKNKEF